MPVSLVDAYTRYQVYLEAYKNGLDERMQAIVMAIGGEIRRALISAGVQHVNELNRLELKRLIRRIDGISSTFHDRYSKQVLSELKELADADTQLTIRVMEHTEGVTLGTAHEQGLGAPLIAGLLAFQHTRQGRNRLWVWVRSQIDPASGLTLPDMVSQYTGFIRRNIGNIVRRGYAENWTIQQTIDAIVGTKGKRYKDGFLSRAYRNGRAAVHTMVQHVSSVAQSAVASMFYEWYEWVSVIDDRTSNICLSRDGKKYRYGQGPLPPAHYFCRSRAVPIRQHDNYSSALPTFYGWIKQQPETVQDDILGKNVARGIRSGRIKSGDLGKFRARGALTAKELLAKYKFIITT